MMKRLARNNCHRTAVLAKINYTGRSQKIKNKKQIYTQLR